MYYPPAFDARSNAQIEHRVPTEKRIVLDEPDAGHFAANAVNIGDTLILHRASDALKMQLSAAGFQVFEAPLTEFIKSGGAARCLTLRLNELPKPGARAHSEISSRVLRLEGHLLDSGMLDRALELTVQNGGSFQILNFQLGKQRQSTSKSEIRVSAPAADVLGNIVGQLIELGSIPAAAERTADAQLETVTIDGVAPDDFYVTTIYPTQVRLNGRWTRIAGQRMDGCIVVDESDPAQLTATVRLMRDLCLGDRVVVGIDGIRTVRKSESREER